MTRVEKPAVETIQVIERRRRGEGVSARLDGCETCGVRCSGCGCGCGGWLSGAEVEFLRESRGGTPEKGGSRARRGG